jgi:acyl-CoA thioesterase-1
MLKIIKQIELWGDSILKGIIYDETRKRYKKLKNETAVDEIARLGFDVTSNTRFGMTAPKARTLMLDALKKGVRAEAVIIEFGGNDCDFQWSEVAENPDGEHKPNTALEVFKRSIADMVKTLREHGILPILTNLPPINSEKYFSWITRNLNAQAILKWLGDKELIYRHHESYSLAIMDVAKNLNCDLIDIRQPFLLKRDYINYLCTDGIHPNVKGYELIKKAVVDFTKSKLLLC